MIEEFQNAVYEWFSGATEIEVIWGNQNAPRPNYPYGTLLITSGPILMSPFAEERTSFDDSRPLGQEVALDEVVPIQFVVSCQIYDNEGLALEYINKAQIALMRPSYLAAFRVANISVARSNPITNISGLIEDKIQSRAGLDVTFNASMSYVEYVGYIEKVKAKSVNLGIDQTFGIGV